MAVFTRSAFVGLAVVLSVVAGSANAQQLSSNFYPTCPNLASIVRSQMTLELQTEKRMAASILRLFFHDCFVNGCDGSILLDGASGEKFANPNINSVRGYEVIDRIKAQVVASCPDTAVSCADILALAARDGVNLVEGPSWTVLLGRKDSLTASQSGANSDLPGPDSSLATLITMFKNKNLSATDMTALSGAHTIGRSQCQNFRNHIYNDNNIDPSFAKQLKLTCPRKAPSGNSNLANFDVQTPDVFDNAYYKNLLAKRGLLHSDQELFNAGSQDALVTTYSNNPSTFLNDFVTAMVKMGNLLPPPGTLGEIRSNCRIPNPK